jgi:type VI secretion system protein ImpJ
MPFGWGLTSLTIDRDRLANGEFVLTQCRGVMPDGHVVDMPDHDAPPPPRSVQEYFPPTQEQVLVYLVAPALRSDGGNVQLQGAPPRRETRYTARTITLRDDTTGADERSIEVARPNWQVRFEGEQLEAYTSVRIAAIKRDISGSYVLDDRMVPVCMGLGASERLQTLLRRLIELLVTKSTSLTERQRSLLSQRELSPGDIATLGLLSAINAHLPVLQHYHAQPRTHPERLYLALSALIGQLSAYLPGTSTSVRELPAYDHGQVAGCFNQLDAVVRDMLGEARPQANFMQLPLQEQRENLFTTTVEEEVLQKAQLFLVARSDAFSEHELIEALPQKLRIAAPSNIDAVLRSYTRALPVQHTHRLPVGMPVDQQANYFQLQKRGPFWESICADGGIAVFVSPELTRVNLELIAVQA